MARHPPVSTPDPGSQPFRLARPQHWAMCAPHNEIVPDIGQGGGNMGRIGWLLAIALGAHPAIAQEHQDQSELLAIERFEDGDAEAGAKLYMRYCRGCHGEDGRGGAHTFMPHVGNLTKKGYIEHLPDGYLYVAIAEGGAAVGKSSYMPAWKSTLSEQEIKNLVAHIRTMPTF